MEKKVLIAGAGVSGIGAAKLLHEEGREVILYDSNVNLDKEKVRDEAGFPLSIVSGELTKACFDAEYCVVSPGIDLAVPFIKELKDAGVPVIGEVELAYRYAKGTLIAITGTNGKTTTATLTGAIMEKAFSHTFTVGNIGTAYTTIANQTTAETVTTAEVSSFQLESTEKFHPHVSSILNITPDHLNRHHTMACYETVKERIAKNQTKDDFCVLNFEDTRLRKFGQTLDVPVIWFSSASELSEGIYLSGKSVIRAHDGVCTEIIRTDQMMLPGIHNAENVMAAIAIAFAMQVPADVIRETLISFKPVPHRLEFVAEKSGVKYYNDSKATNVSAAVMAVKAMDRPTILIAGGSDKGASYQELIDVLPGKVRILILLGATREKIAQEAEEAGFSEIFMAGDLVDAVKMSADLAKSGEAVLFSPACASFDMFDNYEQRGNCFKELVNALSDED